MAKLDIEKKRKTVWPWLAGVAVLVLILWAVTALLTEDPDTEPQVTVPTVEDTQPPAAVPLPPDLDPVATGTPVAGTLEDLVPLGDEDVGRRARLDGRVVGVAEGAFWLATGTQVVRVQSARSVEAGDTLSVEGTLRAADPERVDRLAAQTLQRERAGELSLVRGLQLVEGSPPSPGTGEG